MPLSSPNKETSIYEKGDIQCFFTEEEVEALCDMLDDYEPTTPTDSFVSAAQKLAALYDDHCVKYSLSPALEAYNQKYGTWGTGNPEDVARWEGFRDAFTMMQKSAIDQ
jgi:hypothetical protein